MSGNDKFDDLYKTIRNNFMSLNLILLLGMLFIELVYLVVYTIKGLFDISLELYFLLYIVRPMLVCIITYAVGKIIIQRQQVLHLSSDIIDVIPLCTLTIFIGVAIWVHYVFPCIYAFMVLPICFCTVYGNLRIERIVYIFTNIIFVIAIGLTYLDTYTIRPVKFGLNVLVVFMIMFFVHLFVIKIIRYEKDKEDLVRSLEKDNYNLQQDALLDGLTRLYNYKMLEKTAKEWLSKSKNVIFCIIDIDNFKHCNDTYGHEFGNIVLKRLSWYLSCISSDTILTSRYGGEEFGILFIDKDMKYVVDIMESLRREFKLQEYRETKEKFTFSGGVAKYAGEATIEGLFASADKQLYIAKNSGKDKICY